jgi:hypothetical protein
MNSERSRTGGGVDVEATLEHFPALELGRCPGGDDLTMTHSSVALTAIESVASSGPRVSKDRSSPLACWPPGGAPATSDGHDT